MSHLDKPTMQIRDGDSQTAFNMDLLTTIDIDNNVKLIGNVRGIHTFEGLQIYQTAVDNLDHVVRSILNDQEKIDLAKYRVNPLIQGSTTRSVPFIMNTHKKIDKWETKVREFIQLKGLGVTAKMEDDPRKAILR